MVGNLLRILNQSENNKISFSIPTYLRNATLAVLSLAVREFTEETSLAFRHSAVLTYWEPAL